MKTADSEVENVHSSKKHRANSPSATSDSAISTNRSRKGGKRKQATDHPSDNKASEHAIDSFCLLVVQYCDNMTAFLLQKTGKSTMEGHLKR